MSRSKSVCLYAKECYIDWAAINQNIKFVRKLYKRLASVQPSSVALLYKYVDIELSQVMYYVLYRIDIWMIAKEQNELKRKEVFYLFCFQHLC